MDNAKQQAASEVNAIVYLDDSVLQLQHRLYDWPT